MAILHGEMYASLLDAGAKPETASAAAEALAAHQLAIERLRRDLQLAWRSIVGLAAVTLAAIVGLMLAVGS